MNKEIYLRNLEKLLTGKMPSKEINDILLDYNEYFEAGKVEGKTEEELVIEFGSPKTVVSELLNDSQPTAVDPIRDIKVSLFEKRCLHVLAAMVFFAGLLYSLKTYDLTSHYNSDIIMVLVLPLFLALSGIHKLFAYQSKSPSKKQIRVCTILSAIFMALILAIITGFIAFLLNFHNLILPANTAVIVRTFNSLTYTLCFLVLFTTILILILAGRNFKAIGFLFFLSGEFISALNIFYKFESGTSDMSQYALPVVIRVIYPFVFGIILTAMFFLSMSLKKRFTRNRK